MLKTTKLTFLCEIEEIYFGKAAIGNISKSIYLFFYIFVQTVPVCPDSMVWDR